jgi:hypothetical protein
MSWTCDKGDCGSQAQCAMRQRLPPVPSPIRNTHLRVLRALRRLRRRKVSSRTLLLHLEGLFNDIHMLRAKCVGITMVIQTRSSDGASTSAPRSLSRRLRARCCLQWKGTDTLCSQRRLFGDGDNQHSNFEDKKTI